MKIIYLLFFSLVPHFLFSINYSDYSKNAPVELVLQNGHTDEVNSLSVSLDGKYIASAGKDQIIKIWRQEDGLLIRNIYLRNNIRKVKFAPNGKYIAGCTFEYIKVFQVWNGKLVYQMKRKVGISFISDFVFSPNSRYIYAGIDYSSQFAKKRGAISIWDLTKGKLKEYQETPSLGIKSIAINQDGKTLAAGTDDGQILIYKTDGLDLIKKMKVHKSTVTSLNFSSNGKFLASASTDRKTKVFSLPSFKIYSFFNIQTSFKNELIFNQNSKKIYVGTDSGRLYKWNILTKKMEWAKSFRLSHQFSINCLQQSLNNSFLVMGGKSKLKKNRQLNLLFIEPDQANVLKEIKGYENFIHDLEVDDSEKVFGTIKRDNRIDIWDKNNLRLLRIIPASGDGNYNYDRFDISSDGKWMVYQEGKFIIIKDILTGKLINKLVLPKSIGYYEIIYLNISPNKKYVACVANNKQVYLWNTRKTNPVKIINYPVYISGVIFSKNSQLIFTRHYQKKGPIAYANSISLRIYHIKQDNITKTLWWNLHEKKLVFSYLNQSHTVWSDKYHMRIAFPKSHTFKLVRSITNDYTKPQYIKLISYKDTISFINQGEDWVVLTHDGYFAASKNGGKLIGITQGMNVFAIDQFALKKNRPDIILKRLNSKNNILMNHYHSQYLKRLKKFGLTSRDLSSKLHVPTSQILNFKKEGQWGNMKFKLKDSHFTLKRYNIYVNDSPIFGAFGKLIDGNQKILTQRIKLTSGMNKIEVTCINEKGTESFRALTIIVIKQKKKGNLYYLSFGVSKYKNRKLNLKYAHKDALDLAKVFRKMKGKYFNNIFTKTYINQQVTLQNIKKAKNFLKKAKEEDTFVLFIAGHGVHDTDKNSTYYYLTHKTKLNNLKASAANFEMIEGLLQGINPRKKLFLMDTCESGEVENAKQNYYLANAKTRRLKVRGLKVKIRNNQYGASYKRSYLLDRNRYIYNDLLRRTGAIVFSSSKGGEFSYEKDRYKNGLFTEELLKAFTTKLADQNKDGVLTTNELRNYVIKAVPELSNNLQHPTVDRDNIFQVFSFPVLNKN